MTFRNWQNLNSGTSADPDQYIEFSSPAKESRLHSFVWIMAAMFAVVPGLDRRRSRPQYKRNAESLRTKNGHVANVEARGLKILVACLLFLIDADQPEVRDTVRPI